MVAAPFCNRAKGIQGRAFMKESDSDRVQLKSEMRLLAPRQLGVFIKDPKNRVTAGRVVKIGVHTPGPDEPHQRMRIRLGLLMGNGLDVRQKASLDVKYESDIFIATVVRSSTFQYFEASAEIWILMKDIPVVIEALCSIPDDRTGQSVTDLYVPVPSRNERLVQFMVLPEGDEPLVQLSNFRKNGIGSVRYVPRLDICLGILIDTASRGVGIATIVDRDALVETVKDPRKWTHVADAPSDHSILMLSRPKLKKDESIHLVASLANDYEASLVLRPSAKGYVASWGSPTKTIRRSIGSVTGQSSTYAAFTPGPDSARVELTPLEQADPIAKEYLQK